MTKRIFRSLIGISLVVCMIGMTTVFAVLYYYFDDQIINELQSEANYLAVYVEENGAKALQVLPQDFQRVTLVAQDGKVLYEQLHRPEPDGKSCTAGGNQRGDGEGEAPVRRGTPTPSASR